MKRNGAHIVFFYRKIKYRASSVGSGRNIIVSSNCQTGGIAAALQVIFPDDQITPIPLPTFASETDELQFVKKLRDADVWVSIGQFELVEKHRLSDKLKLIKIPRVRFSGFHPDLIYAKLSSTNAFIDPHYNSAIAVWAYKNGSGASDARRLFNTEVFSALGYMNSWENGVAGLKQIFEGTDINFSEFMLGVRREGLFMYSLNHPKVHVLARLAKLISLHMGMERDVMDKSIDINDGLSDVIWPLYPEIGDILALPSAYEWKMGDGQWVFGLDAYLESAYANYANQRISPGDIMMMGVNESVYDRVLGGQLGIKNG